MKDARDDRAHAALRCAELYLNAEDLLRATPERKNAHTRLLQQLQEGHSPAFHEVWKAVDVVLLECTAMEAAAVLKKHALQPALIYIDPPYASHRDYVFAQKHPEDGRRIERVAFSDRWDGGMDAYVDALSPVLEAAFDALEPNGSLLLHVDPRGAPYLSIRCDQIFGLGERLAQKNAPGFRNELIWSYGLGGSSPRSWPKKHDNILWYSKSDDWYFEAPMTPARSNRMKGQLKKQPDVIDIPTINNMAKDRTGYPTQKPIELLDMLVQAHAPRGSLVVDFFSGSGTTALAAFRSERTSIASDQSNDAIAVGRQRLLEAGASLAIWRPDRIVRTQTDTPPTAEDSLVYSCEGAMMGAVFVSTSSVAPTHRLMRDVFGQEGCVEIQAE